MSDGVVGLMSPPHFVNFERPWQATIERRVHDVHVVKPAWLSTPPALVIVTGHDRK